MWWKNPRVWPLGWTSGLWLVHGNLGNAKMIVNIISAQKMRHLKSYEKHAKIKSFISAYWKVHFYNLGCLQFGISIYLLVIILFCFPLDKMSFFFFFQI